MNWNLFWTAFGAIGGTIGAFATTVAVIVALWQTKYSYKKKIKLTFTDNIIVFPSNGGFLKKYVGLTVTNTGNRDVVIHNWGFEINKENNALINPDNSALGRELQVQLPHRLIVEDSIMLYYERDLFVNLLNEMSEKKQININKKILFFVTDSIGKKHKVYTNKIAKDLLTSLDDAQNNIYI